MKKITLNFKNFWFLLRICFKHAPMYTYWYMFDKIRNEVGIFLEHTLAVFMVLSAVEFGRPFYEVALWLLALVGFEIIHMSMDSYRSFKLAPLAIPVIQQALKSQLFQRAKHLDLESYDDPKFYNDYILAINESDSQLDRALMTMEHFVSSITRILLTSGFFLLIDPFAFIFVFTSFVLTFLMDYLINQLNFKRNLEVVPIEREAEYIQRVFYLPDYAKELRLNPNMPVHFQHTHQMIYDKLQAVEKKYINKLWLLNWLKDYVFDTIVMSILFMIYLIYAALILNSISIASVAVLYGSAWALSSGLAQLCTTLNDITDISRYVHRIKTFLQKEPTIISRLSLPIERTEPSVIEFKNVSFRYSLDTPAVLENINLTIEAGKKTAIVGYNGAGKSTLVKLIMRLYDPTEGEILYNGINIKDYDVSAYREGIGIIFQDFKLFAASVFENILLDSVDSREEKPVLEAIKQAGFTHRLEKLALGLAQPLTTEFDDEGVNLSGGEAQKIAIARALYKESPLVILDEPSSALDPMAEYNLNQTVIDAGAKKSLIFISHRLSTTRIADQIFLLEHGKIVEQGTHDQLLALHGHYAQMWEVQTSKYHLRSITP